MRSPPPDAGAPGGSVSRTARSAEVARWCAAVNLAVGTLVLTGWVFDLRSLTSAVPGLATTKFNTAACFTALGFSLWSAVPKSGRPRRGLVVAAATLVVALAGVSLLQDLTGWNLGIDELLVRDSATGAGAPGRMSQATALGLAALATGVLAAHAGRLAWGSGMAIAGGTIGVIGLAGYLLDAQELYEVAGFSSVALPTALLLVVSGIGAIAAFPGGAIAGPLTSPYVGGQLARRTIAFASLLFATLAALGREAEDLGLFGRTLGVALLVVGGAFGVALAGWIAARWLNDVHSALERSRRRQTVLALSTRAASVPAGSEDFLARFCRLLIDPGPMREALVVLAGAGGLRVAARAGDAGPSSGSPVLTPAVTTITERAMREARPVVQRDPVAGLVAASPIREGADAIGALAVRLDDGPFAVEEIDLAEVVAGDLTLALTTAKDAELRAEAGRAAATLAAMVESSDDAIIVKSLDGVITRWNAAAERLFGYTAEEVTGRPITVLLPEGWADEEASILARIRDGRRVEPFDTVRRRKDGALVNVSVAVSPVRDEEGRVIAASNVSRDISRRVELERRTRLVFDTVPSALLMVDRQSRIVLANDAAVALFGYDREALVGQPIELLVPAESRAAHGHLAAGFFTAPSSRPMGAGRDLSARRQDGRLVPVEIALSPMQTADGWFVVASIVDLSDRLKTLAELKRSNAELERFAYVASHDLQEPLRAVSGCVQLLRKRYASRLDAAADELIDHTVDGASRMQALIDGLLQFARVSAQGVPPRAASCETALDLALKNLAASIAQQQATIERGPLPEVWANPGQLVMVFQNLIGNAVKFRGEQPPVVRVTASEAPGEWVVTVADNGIGIPADQLDRIFVIFQRLHTRAAYPGTGLGLALVKRIVEQSGGRIWVESAPGDGSRFHVALPRAPHATSSTVSPHPGPGASVDGEAR